MGQGVLRQVDAEAHHGSGQAFTFGVEGLIQAGGMCSWSSCLVQSGMPCSNPQQLPTLVVARL